MAQYVIEIEDSVLNQIADAFAASYGYKETVLNEEGAEVPNPDSKIDFMRKQTAKFWQDVLMSHIKQEAWKQTEAQLAEIQVALSAQTV